MLSGPACRRHGIQPEHFFLCQRKGKQILILFHPLHGGSFGQWDYLLLHSITQANLSVLKNNKAKAVRFSTLEAICAALDCQPGDILEFVPDGEDGP